MYGAEDRSREAYLLCCTLHADPCSQGSAPVCAISAPTGRILTRFRQPAAATKKDRNRDAHTPEMPPLQRCLATSGYAPCAQNPSLLPPYPATPKQPRQRSTSLRNWGVLTILAARLNPALRTQSFPPCASCSLSSTGPSPLSPSPAPYLACAIPLPHNGTNLKEMECCLACTVIAHTARVCASAK